MGYFINRSEGTTSNEQSGTSSHTPWGPQAKQLRFGFREARRLYGDKLSYFPGDTVAPRSEASLAAGDLRRARATAGSPILRAGQAEVEATAGGAYLGANPYLDMMYSRLVDNAGSEFTRNALPALEARFARAGQAGSPQYQAALSNAYGGLSSDLAGAGVDLYGGAYETERSRMMDAARISPFMAAADYADIDQLERAGLTDESYEQRQIDAKKAKHDFEEMEGWQRLGLFNTGLGSPIQGTTNWSQTSTSDSSGRNFGLQPDNSPDQPATWERVLGMIFGAL